MCPALRKDPCFMSFLPHSYILMDCIPICQMWKLMPRVVETLTRDHTVRGGQWFTHEFLWIQKLTLCQPFIIHLQETGIHGYECFSRCVSKAQCDDKHNKCPNKAAWEFTERAFLIPTVFREEIRSWPSLGAVVFRAEEMGFLSTQGGQEGPFLICLLESAYFEAQLPCALATVLSPPPAPHVSPRCVLAWCLCASLTPRSPH